MEIHEYLRGTGHDMIGIYKVPAAVDDSKKMTTGYLHEEYKDLIRASIDYVAEHHHKGMSFERFDASNLVVEGGLLKFRGVKVKNSLSLEDGKRDYGSLHDIIENLLWEHNPGNYRCEALDDLLKCLEANSMVYSWATSTVYDEMLQNHFAILGDNESLELVKNFAEKSSYISDIRDRARYSKAVNEMERHKDNEGNWTRWFNGSHPCLGPAKDCFDFVPKAKKIPYNNTNHSILWFDRHMATHLKDHMKKYKRDVTEKDVNLTIMALFGTELLSFHKLIFEHGISHYFVGGQEQKLSSAGQPNGASQGRQPNQGGQTIQGAARGSYIVTRQTS